MVTNKFEDIGPANMVVTHSGISRNRRYLAVLQTPVAKDGNFVNGKIASVYDTTTLQLEWTCDVIHCDHVTINDNGNVLFANAYRRTLVSYECQLNDGVKVIVKHTLPSLVTIPDAMCFLHGNNLIVGTAYGKLVKLDINNLQGIIPYHSEGTLTISLIISKKLVNCYC